MYRFATKERYDGEWKEDCKHGKGRVAVTVGAIFYNEGEAYEGDWKYDRPEGIGNVSL